MQQKAAKYEKSIVPLVTIDSMKIYQISLRQIFGLIAIFAVVFGLNLQTKRINREPRIRQYDNWIKTLEVERDSMTQLQYHHKKKCLLDQRRKELGF
jgi:hypothetical protein